MFCLCLSIFLYSHICLSICSVYQFITVFIHLCIQVSFYVYCMCECTYVYFIEFNQDTRPCKMQTTYICKFSGKYRFGGSFILFLVNEIQTWYDVSSDVEWHAIRVCFPVSDWLLINHHTSLRRPPYLRPSILLL